MFALCGCGRVNFDRRDPPPNVNDAAQARCDDSELNGAETGIDCGGLECAPCDSGQRCLLQTDCQSGVCRNETCAAPTCDDGVTNGTEQFIDSGGACTVRAPTCGEGIDPWTVALFDFENLPATSVIDPVGAAVFEVFSDRLSESRIGDATPSTANCGTALTLTGRDFGQILHDARWLLPQGSIDFWFRAPTAVPTATAMGIVTKDAIGFGAGQLAVLFLIDGRIAARLQDGTSEAYRCSGRVAPSEWVHIGVNWGSGDFELWIDRKKAVFRGTVRVFSPASEDPCTTNLFGAGLGLDGNTEPFAVGANNFSSVPGTNLPLQGLFADGAAIDHLRISRVARDFAR